MRQTENKQENNKFTSMYQNYNKFESKGCKNTYYINVKHKKARTAIQIPEQEKMNHFIIIERLIHLEDIKIINLHSTDWKFLSN